jgi:5'-nucleotidase (lipoprotein e(P4) family)
MMMRITPSVTAVCIVLGLTFPGPTANTYENLNAVLWVQTSVEYRASTLQTYRNAEAALLHGLHDKHWTAALEQTDNFEDLPPAVILDLDETVLDNSVFSARLVVSGEHYSDEQWAKWVSEESAGLVPGASDFLQFAHTNGVASVYITNRVCDSSKDDDPTVRLLRSLRLPVEPIRERLMCAQGKNDSDKTARRAKCAAKYRVLLLFGDQLGDFLQIPPELSNLKGREKLFTAYQRLWGERWFQLPNPMYGSWEGAVGYGVTAKLSNLKK